MQNIKNIRYANVIHEHHTSSQSTDAIPQQIHSWWFIFFSESISHNL